MHNYCSFVFKMSLRQQKSVFLILKPYKTSLKLLRKKSHNLHYLSHNWHGSKLTTNWLHLRLDFWLCA